MAATSPHGTSAGEERENELMNHGFYNLRTLGAVVPENSSHKPKSHQEAPASTAGVITQRNIKWKYKNVKSVIKNSI